MRSDLDILERVTRWFRESVGFATPELLGAATPCDDWNVTQLLDHVTGGNHFSMKILSGASADVALQHARDSFGVDHDAVAAAESSSRDQLDGFLACDLGATYNHVVGELTGEQVLRLRIHDMSIHTWDLLQAVNPQKGLDPVYVRWAIEELATPESLTARHIATRFERPSKSFELLMAFGRQRAHAQSNLRERS